MTIRLTDEQHILYLDGGGAAWRIAEALSSVRRVPGPLMSRRPA